LFDPNETVELVEFVGVLVGGVVHVEVSELNVRIGPVGVRERLAARGLSAPVVLCAAGVLETVRGAAESRDRRSIRADAHARGERIAAVDRFLYQRVVCGVQSVRHGDHVVEPAEEGVSFPVADQL
jgi:hypothetical protein